MSSDLTPFIWRKLHLTHITCIVTGTLCLLWARQPATVKIKYMFVSLGLERLKSMRLRGAEGNVHIPLPMSFLWHFHLTSHKLRRQLEFILMHAVDGKRVSFLMTFCDNTVHLCIWQKLLSNRTCITFKVCIFIGSCVEKSRSLMLLMT